MMQETALRPIFLAIYSLIFFAHPLHVLNDIFDPPKATEARPRKLGLRPQTPCSCESAVQAVRRVRKNLPAPCVYKSAASDHEWVARIQAVEPRVQGVGPLRGRAGAGKDLNHLNLQLFQPPASREQGRAQACEH